MERSGNFGLEIFEQRVIKFKFKYTLGVKCTIYGLFKFLRIHFKLNNP